MDPLRSGAIFHITDQKLLKSPPIIKYQEIKQSTEVITVNKKYNVEKKFEEIYQNIVNNNGPLITLQNPPVPNNYSNYPPQTHSWNGFYPTPPPHVMPCFGPQQVTNLNQFHVLQNSINYGSSLTNQPTNDSSTQSHSNDSMNTPPNSMHQSQRNIESALHNSNSSNTFNPPTLPSNQNTPNTAKDHQYNSPKQSIEEHTSLTSTPNLSISPMLNDQLKVQSINKSGRRFHTTDSLSNLSTTIDPMTTTLNNKSTIMTTSTSKSIEAPTPYDIDVDGDGVEVDHHPIQRKRLRKRKDIQETSPPPSVTTLSLSVPRIQRNTTTLPRQDGWKPSSTPNQSEKTASSSDGIGIGMGMGKASSRVDWLPIERVHLYRAYDIVSKQYRGSSSNIICSVNSQLKWMLNTERWKDFEGMDRKEGDDVIESDAFWKIISQSLSDVGIQKTAKECRNSWAQSLQEANERKRKNLLRKQMNENN